MPGSVAGGITLIRGYNSKYSSSPGANTKRFHTIFSKKVYEYPQKCVPEDKLGKHDITWWISPGDPE